MMLFCGCFGSKIGTGKGGRGSKQEPVILHREEKSYTECLGLFLNAYVAFRKSTTEFTTRKDFNAAEDFSAKPLVKLQISYLTHTANMVASFNGIMVFTW